MKEFETPAISLNQGLRRFKSVRNSSQLEECFNLSPTENGLEVHEILTDLNADGVTWDGLGKLERPMESDTLTINVTSYIDLDILDGVTVYIDNVSQGATDSDGNVSAAGITVGIHDLKLTKSGIDDSDVDVIYNDYIIVEPLKEVTINVDDLWTDANIEGIDVYVDGKKMGRTNASGNVTAWLRPGVHKLRLVKGGFETSDDDLVVNDYFTVT